MLTTLIFDFDGVIVESIPLKTAAFREVFSFVPDHLDEIIAYHLENGGMSRYDKFRYIYADILHEPLTPEQEEHLAGEYVRRIFDAMLTVSYAASQSFGASPTKRASPGAAPVSSRISLIHSAFVFGDPYILTKYPVRSRRRAISRISPSGVAETM